MLKTRVITAVILLVGLLAALFFLPPYGWLAFCALLCAGAAWEWGGLAGWGRRGRVAYGVLLGGLSFVLGVPLLTHSDGYVLNVLYALYALALGFWVLLVPFWLRYKWRLQNWSALLLGAIVLMPPTLAFVLLRDISPIAVLEFSAIVWVADIAAYFTGRAFGGKKLAPGISPGKTWAGAVGAVLGVLVYCNVIYLWAGPGMYCDGNNLTFVLQPVFIVLAVFSIIGDLFESLLKRQAGVKDSSSLLPGHGGILDRIDSLTSTLPLVVAFAILAFALEPWVRGLCGVHTSY
jgi:phosphatidate cytidylyltransferase